MFLLAHTLSNQGSEAPPSVFHVATRQPPSTFIFQKIANPAEPFGLNRSPPHHFILRLREFPPNLRDLVIVASTASTDIGLFSRSKVPLTKEKPADKITGVFTMSEMMDDSRRAILPMSGDQSDTSPIGLALDLSSKEKVFKPISSDEIDESPTPLPALMVLNNEGVLASWWIVYSESIRQQTIYPGLVSAGGSSQPPSSPAPAQTSTPAFGGSSTSAFESPSSSGSPFVAKPTTSFGGVTGTFGNSSGLGQRTSVWGAPSTSASAAATSKVPAFGTPTLNPKSLISAPSSTFGAPAFGSTTAPSFGSSGLPGSRPSIWGSGASTTQGPTFGQPGGLGKPAAAFGSGAPATGMKSPASGGFASFASGGGFAAAAAAPSATAGSIFGAKPASAIFSIPSTGSGMDTGSAFGSSANKVENKTSVFGGGSGSSGFVLGSTFEADTSGKDDGPELSEGTKNPFFGGNFGNALGDAAKMPVAETPVSKEADMDSTDEPPKPAESPKLDSTTPISTPAPVKSLFSTSAPPARSGLFGTAGPATVSPTTTPPVSVGFSLGTAATDNSNLGGLNFGNFTTSASKPLLPATHTPTGTKILLAPKMNEEPSSDGEGGSSKDNISDPPLPPDPISKTSYTAGDTSISSVDADAPLPPDFIPKAPPSLVTRRGVLTPIPADLIPPSDVPGGPEDDGDESGFELEEDGDDSEGASDEGSGEDVTKGLSPTSENNQTPGLTPQCSFGGLNHRNSNSLFAKIQKPGQANLSRALFGEINGSATILPPPKVQASPRSPSPVRTALPPRMLRPDAARSVSAPDVASHILGRKTPAPFQGTFSLSQQQKKAENSAGRRLQLERKPRRIKLLWMTKTGWCRRCCYRISRQRELLMSSRPMQTTTTLVLHRKMAYQPRLRLYTGTLTPWLIL